MPKKPPLESLNGVHSEGCDGVYCTCKKKPKTIRDMLKKEKKKDKPKDFWGLA